MGIHRTFKFEISGRFIVFLPSLHRVFEVTQDDLTRVPDFIESSDQLCMQEPSHNSRYISATLVVTTACNLRCSYCYEANEGPRPTPLFMRMRLAKKIVDSVIDQSYKDKLGARFYFFGGEATLALPLIMKTVPYIKDQAQSRHVESRCLMTTNAVMSDPVASWVIANFEGLTVSLDGIRDVHNTQRSNSFNRVIRTLDGWYEADCKKLQIRMTVSADGVSRLPQSADFIANRYPGVTIHVEPVIGLGKAKELVRPPDYDEFFDRLLESIDIARKYGSKLTTGILRTHGNKTGFCSASSGGRIFLPDGTIATCPRLALSPDPLSVKHFRLGHIDVETGLINLSNEQRTNSELLKTANIPECQNCFARQNCLGDCPANKSAMQGSSFWEEPSYRCEAIKRFYAKYLLTLIDNNSKSP